MVKLKGLCFYVCFGRSWKKVKRWKGRGGLGTNKLGSVRVIVMVLSCSILCLLCCWAKIHKKSIFKYLFYIILYVCHTSSLKSAPPPQQTHARTLGEENNKCFRFLRPCTVPEPPAVLFVMELHSATIDTDVFRVYCTLLVSSIVARVQSLVQRQIIHVVAASFTSRCRTQFLASPNQLSVCLGWSTRLQLFILAFRYVTKISVRGGGGLTLRPLLLSV